MNAKILYIEDNPQNFYLVKYILTAKGHEVSWAHDGREGLAAAARARPDLVLLDIQLPVMDGYAVARSFRADPGLATIPLVALTSYAMAGDRQKALESGCDGYIEKPLNPKTFAAQIGQYLPGNTPEAREP
ncbi:MAG TPA: response regulator [Elusimicrobiales bacterium]|nr:response regulator [Elusimicrobiales bacterium]